MVQKTVLKVDISCHKCKKKILEAISEVQGVDKIEVHVSKGTITVTGNADPYEIIVRTRKTGKFVEVVSVGPPPAPPKQEPQKKPKGEKPDPNIEIHNPLTCPICQQMSAVHMDRYAEPSSGCCIL